MTDYTKTITGSSTFTDGNTIKCDNATITVEKSSTGVFKGLEAIGKVTLNCTSCPVSAPLPLVVWPGLG